MKNTTQHPFNWKWAHPTDKGGKSIQLKWINGMYVVVLLQMFCVQ